MNGLILINVDKFILSPFPVAFSPSLRREEDGNGRTTKKVADFHRDSRFVLWMRMERGASLEKWHEKDLLLFRIQNFVKSRRKDSPLCRLQNRSRNQAGTTGAVYTRTNFELVLPAIIYLNVKKILNVASNFSKCQWNLLWWDWSWTIFGFGCYRNPHPT